MVLKGVLVYMHLAMVLWDLDGWYWKELGATLWILCGTLPSIFNQWSWKNSLGLLFVFSMAETDLETFLHKTHVGPPLPDPWLSWALIWTSCMHEDPGYGCSYLPGQWCSCEHGWIPGFPSSLSLCLVLFLLPWEEQVQHCHHVSVYKYKLRACMVKLVHLLLCWSYTSEG